MTLINYFKKKFHIGSFEENHSEELFDGYENSYLFLKTLNSAKFYAEYGCGLSTQYVISNTDLNVISVDTSLEWVTRVKEKLDGSRLNIHYIDVGPVGDWGRPKDYSKRDGFIKYTDLIWQQEELPDIVLIDGRFRVACFLTCLINANEGTKIIFDDYSNRPHYHIVEEFLVPINIVGRQALFITKKLDTKEKKDIIALLNTFRNVMD